MGDEHNSVDSGLVYDVGAHLGQDSDFYLKLGYRVVAIEANPELVARLRERFRAEIDDGTYVLIADAIAESGEEITFYVNKKMSVWGTADAEWAARNRNSGADSEEITVKCVRFIDLLLKYGCPSYLKIDIEGADMLCVKDLALLQSRPAYLSIESTKTSWSDLMMEFKALERLGYSRFQVVNQRKHRGGKFVTRDGGVIDYTFESGASGPFGENRKGKWLTKSQAIAKYLAVFMVYKTVGDNTMLSKFIKKLPILYRVLGLVPWYDTHAMKG